MKSHAHIHFIVLLFDRFKQVLTVLKPGSFPTDLRFGNICTLWPMGPNEFFINVSSISKVKNLLRPAISKLRLSLIFKCNNASNYVFREYILYDYFFNFAL